MKKEVAEVGKELEWSILTVLRAVVACLVSLPTTIRAKSSAKRREDFIILKHLDYAYSGTKLRPKCRITQSDAEAMRPAIHIYT
ncbi:hypothetical protein GCM10011383_28990 [Hymenobacter cavernae]|uniref:Uncharacterized protein n=1 Tax=Hymenobacter cavernae TaxID=2044852 RepID=A0ABQ1UEJ3_9BACT|nr:hypothetical protein GCM10011383_28990 [Hymenobacter cavernae]